jgi:hypothetical protein
MRKSLLPGLLFLFVFTTCSEDPIVRTEYKADTAIQWAEVALKTIQDSWPNSPTFTSRALGYIGLTMYESVVHGSAIHESMAGSVNGLGLLPAPVENASYDWEIALNAGQASIIRSLYPHRGEYSAELINSTETSIHSRLSANADPTVVQRSVEFGVAVANAIFEWSKTDGGHEGYTRNFDFTYQVPFGEGYWTAPSSGQSASPLPLHPHWGDNRTFVGLNQSIPEPALCERSTKPGSRYHSYFLAVYLKRMHLSEEEKRIAAWWADDPTQTASPPGHSYNLATICIKTADVDIYTAAEAYAKVGMAVADSFIKCWKTKFVYHSERPFPFIRANIDSLYQQFWPEPPFPAFPSGHSTQASASAIVLMSIFGKGFSLIDDTYKNREIDFAMIEYKPRFFKTLWETARECAYSRFLGGIHTEHDNDEGMKLGKTIGSNITNLEWRK